MSALGPHSKRTIDRAVHVLDDHDYASLGREVRRLQADHDRLREALTNITNIVYLGNATVGASAIEKARTIAQEALDA